jgi:predicted O-methyltransferase YrrM
MSNNIDIMDIPGWFDFNDIYDDAVSNAIDNAHFVECGVFCGKSTIYMASKIKQSNKKITFDAVDTFKPNDCFGITQNTFEYFANFFDVRSYINLIVQDQFNIISTYKDNSLDFIFLDSIHTFEATKLAIEQFKPKLKNGGVLAGHDYTREFPGVLKAVQRTLTNIRTSKSSFIWQKP